MVKTSRYLKIGPGGRNCSCCFPAPGSKDRRKQYRIAKRKADLEAMKNAEQDIIDADEFYREMESHYYETYYNEFDCDSGFDDDWSDYYDVLDLQMQLEDERCAEGDHYDGDYGSCYDYDYEIEYRSYDYVPSEQERVARALSVVFNRNDLHWRQYLMDAKDFIAAIKRNAR